MIYFVQRSKDNAIKIAYTKLLSSNTIATLKRHHGEVILLGWTLDSKQDFMKLTAKLKNDRVEKGWYSPTPYLLHHIDERALLIQPNDMPSEIVNLQKRVQQLEEHLSHQTKRVVRLETWYNNCLEREKSPITLSITTKNS